MQVRAEQSCRFSRTAQAVAGVVCSCEGSAADASSTADSCIARELVLDLVIGVSQPCGGSSTRATALPFEVEFEASSVPAGRCSIVQLQVVSRFEHRYVAPASVASTFVPQITRGSFELANSRRAVIGQFSADGVEVRERFLMLQHALKLFCIRAAGGGGRFGARALHRVRAGRASPLGPLPRRRLCSCVSIRITSCCNELTAHTHMHMQSGKRRHCAAGLGGVAQRRQQHVLRAL